jgi:predicted kinase
MGAGKSTWLKEHDLEKYTLCADTMRLHLTAPRIGIQGKDCIDQTNNRQAWDMLFYFLEERMKNGEFTIIDAVHSKSSEFSRYKSLAEQYRYRLYCVDFTDVPIEVAKERNAQRPEYKQVPEGEIDKVYSRFATQGKTSGFTVVKPEDFESILTIEPYDWNNYKNIHIFGDIHGCYTALCTYFKENPFSEEDGYIFVGDYFDRGIENVETFNLVTELMAKQNTLFLTGNHELSLRDYAFGFPVKSKDFVNHTAVQFAEAGIENTDLRQLYRRLGVAAYITFRGNDFIISHGGIPYMPKQSIDYYAAISFIKGVGTYDDDIDEIFDTWAQKENEIREHPIYQIHGHRNIFNHPLVHKEYSYNLEGKIEFGGELRVLTIKDDGSFNPQTIQNTVFDEQLLAKKQSSPDGIVHTSFSNMGMFIQELRRNKFIQEKMLGDGVSAFNFTRNAFEKGIWNNITTQARGLFIDIENEKIQARSYNKFFNKNEREETRFGSLVQNLKFPVKFYKKYNGFLGILSMRNGELYFCSKSSNSGIHTEYFKNIFYRIYNEEQINAIKERFTKEDITMVFEVIDPVNDPHIIKYNKQDLVLLEMIYNTVEFKKVKYEHLKAFGVRNNINVKELCYEINNIQEFLSLNGEVEATDYKYNGEFIEGFVVEDAEGFMFKYKLYYYNTWKSLRWVLDRYMKNPTGVNKFTNSLTTPVENYFLGFLKEKYPNGEKIGDEETVVTDIISERDDFIRNGGVEI